MISKRMIGAPSGNQKNKLTGKTAKKITTCSDCRFATFEFSLQSQNKAEEK